MGCTNSKQKFVVNPAIAGQDERALEIFTVLCFTDKDLDLLFTVFSEIDIEQRGSIKPIEFFAYFQMDHNSFEDHIFLLFDYEKNGSINFLQFVCFLWLSLTVGDTDMALLAYLLKDPSAVMKLQHHEVKEIIEIVHQKKVESSPNLLQMFNNCKEIYSSEVSLKDFCRWSLLNGSFITPILLVQLKLRKQILGEKFWGQMVTRKAENPDICALDFVKNLQASVKKCIEDHREGLKQQERDKINKKRKDSKAKENEKSRERTDKLEEDILKRQKSRLEKAPSGKLEKSTSGTGKNLQSSSKSDKNNKSTKKLKVDSEDAPGVKKQASKKDLTASPASSKASKKYKDSPSVSNRKKIQPDSDNEQNDRRGSFGDSRPKSAGRKKSEKDLLDSPSSPLKKKKSSKRMLVENEVSKKDTKKKRKSSKTAVET